MELLGLGEHPLDNPADYRGSDAALPIAVSSRAESILAAAIPANLNNMQVVYLVPIKCPHPLFKIKNLGDRISKNKTIYSMILSILMYVQYTYNSDEMYVQIVGFWHILPFQGPFVVHL